MAEVEPILELRGVQKFFDGRQVLKNIDLVVAPGETLVIIGGSGCGKSTLLRTIIGEHTPDAGHVYLWGEDVCHASPRRLNRIRQRFGILFQSGALYSSMTVGENVALPLREHTDLDDKIVQMVVKMKLELVGLRDFENLMPSQISGGMRKRVGLARAIARDPEILFYDEPTAGLDPIATSVIDQLVIDLRTKLGVTSLVVTHDMKSALRIADRLAMLYNGEFIAIGPPEDFRNPADPRVRQFVEGLADGPIPLRVSKTDYLADLLGVHERREPATGNRQPG
jgi:phospholipid/cholesterol/gamma-HCH transport system ATP-binding protein